MAYIRYRARTVAIDVLLSFNFIFFLQPPRELREEHEILKADEEVAIKYTCDVPGD